MPLLFAILIFITCILLVLVVLVQNPKGGGLSSAFGGSSSGTQILGGVKKTTDFLDRSTWTLAIALLVLVLASNLFLERGAATQQLEDSAIQNQIDEGFAPPPPAAVVPSSSPAELSDGLPESVEEE
jgi:preprotein translocase subunit SecG